MTTCYKNVLIAVSIIIIIIIIIIINIIEPSTDCSFTCLNLAIETLNQGVKSVQSYHKGHQKDVKWCSSGVFIVNFVHCIG